MANVNLFLKANGNDIAGEPESFEGAAGSLADSIEYLCFMDDVTTAREAGSALATGERRYSPVRILKRVDKSTPLIAKALSMNEVIEGKFEFRRPSPVGDGTREHYFTIQIFNGRVDSIQRTSPDVTELNTPRPMQEWVSFVFEKIIWTHVPGGTEHQDSWRERY